MSLLVNPSSSETVHQEAREQLAGILDRYELSDQEEGPLAYPVRASLRLIEGGVFSPPRFWAMERHFLKQRIKLEREWSNDGDQQISLPPMLDERATIPALSRLSFEDCRGRIEALSETVAVLPEELQFIDLKGKTIRQVIVRGDAIAGRVIPLPIAKVFDAIFSRKFKIGQNKGDLTQFWAERVKIEAFHKKPSARVSFNLTASEEFQALLIALQTFLDFRNPIQILLEGSFEWLGQALSIPMVPVELSSHVIRPDGLFGTVTPILVPLGRNETAFAIKMEDKLLSKNPSVFVRRMVAKMLQG